jgi:hypothetical protein
MFHQAMSPVIRARNQATIRIGGEQGRAAVQSCLLAGITAPGLSWPAFRRQEIPNVYRYAVSS